MIKVDEIYEFFSLAEKNLLFSEVTQLLIDFSLAWQAVN